MDELLFEEIEAKVVNHSAAYLNSTAFRKALDFVERTNNELYRELINIEFHEAFD